MYSLVVTGFMRQAPYLCSLLNTHAGNARAVFYGESRTAVLRGAFHALCADASITFAGPRPNPIIQKVCGFRKKPAIVLWAGTDVIETARRPLEIESLRVQQVVHWACAPHLVTELAELGVEAEFVPVASATVPEAPPPLPETFTVLSYLPSRRREFYGQRLVWQAARALPSARFIVVGEGSPDPGAPPNVSYVGEVRDINRYIDVSTVLLRFAEHDGLARMVVESLARGRHIVWNYAFPAVQQVSSYSSAIDALLALFKAHQGGTLTLNVPGMQHVAAAYLPKAIARGIMDRIAEAVRHSQRTPADTAAPKFAISGNNVFSRRVALNCHLASPPITTSLLRTDSFSDRIAAALDVAGSDVWYAVGEPVSPQLLELAATLTRKRRIVHWLGSELNILKRDARLRRRYRSARFEHLAQTEAVAAQLRDFGLQCSLAPLAAAAAVRIVRPLPQRFTVMLYLPQENPACYGRHQFERLMQALRAEPISYIVVGGGAITVPAGIDVEQLVWQPDLADVYDRVTVLARFTQPNTFSNMVVETLMHGRFVLLSDDFPLTEKIHTYRDLELGVRDLLRRHIDGSLRPRYGAARHTARVYAPDVCLRPLLLGCGARRTEARA